MPDGIRTTERIGSLEGRGRSWALDRVDRALVASGLLTGRRGDFGSSDPDLILSWGPGWEPSLGARAPRARILTCGSPTSDILAEVPKPPGAGHLLICSQPLLWPPPVPPASEARAWYSWLTDMAGNDDPRVRIRLHPSECSPSYPLPAELDTLGQRPPPPLVEDLAWADVVLAPYSSILVEAVGAGRVAMSAAPAAAWGRVAANAFLHDVRLPTANFRDAPQIDALLRRAAAAAADVSGLRDTYLSNVGTASQYAASAIVALSAPPIPAPG
jgi:hypothetical protein